VFAKLCIGALVFAGCFLPTAIFAQVQASTSASTASSVQDTRLVPVHAAICDDKVVDKTNLLFQLLANASPTVSDPLKYALKGNWFKLVTDENICPKFKGCGPKDAQAVESVHLNYTVFVSDGDRQGFYRASRPDITVGQYFQSADNNVNPIYCTSKDESPATPPSSPLDVNSSVRVRGVSDDLWIPQKDPLFAKSSSASANYTQNESGVPTNTTTVTAALGYDIPLLSSNAAFSHEIIPFAATNTSLTDTHLKPRVLAPTNFVAGGFLYDANIQGINGFGQLIFKLQQVDGTTMHSELTSVQTVFAPWLDAGATAPFPPLNTMINIYPGSDLFPHVNGQLLFDLRNDLGFYEDRGNPAYIAHNKNFDRVGSRFGYAFIATPSSLPTFSLSVTETALYGTYGSYRNLSYFDSLLQIYFDTKKYFSATLEYTNGRDENTYVITHDYKAGLAGHF